MLASKSLKKLKERNDIKQNLKIKKNMSIPDFNKLDIEIPNNLKKKKISDVEFKIPEYSEYNLLSQNNYNVMQLREIAGKYNIKKNNTKPVLIKSIYNFLFLSNKVIKFQAIIRKRLVKKLFDIKGPGFLNKKLCVNETDFYTLEDLSSISNAQFFSYRDSDNFIYGFDICSLIEYLKRDDPVNPYNRKKINKPSMLKKIKRNINLSKIIFHEKIKITIEKDIITPKKLLELRIHKIFQKMDELGNYTNYEWFNKLNRHELIKFIRELADIWCYRLNIPTEIRRKICPRDPFREINLVNIININDEILKKLILTIVENLILSSNNPEYQSLGSIYVLTALTLVNQDAANALPWLYQSVAPTPNNALL